MLRKLAYIKTAIVLTSKVFFSTFLKDSLLLGFSVVGLLIFTLLLIAPDHTLGLWEGNMGILILEFGVCLAVGVWTGRRIIRLFKEERRIKI